MAAGGFDLRGWEHSGSTEEKNPTTVLGLVWDRVTDRLKLSRAALEEPRPARITKRVILSATHKVFDPMGMGSPVLLRPKMILQKLWTKQLNWDTEVSDNVKREFCDWYDQLPLLRELYVPRWCFKGGREKNTSLHMFVDASGDAYAAVLFARTKSLEGVSVQFVEAKTRVAPLGKTTIPRLELLAATMGARLMASTVEVLDADDLDKYYWSDSTTVLAWIKRESLWATFVWNRVQEIRRLSDQQQWRHVPGVMNPADLPSRGCSAQHLISSGWLAGPAWLQNPESEWPKLEQSVDEKEVNQEVKEGIAKKTIETTMGLFQHGKLRADDGRNPESKVPWYIEGLSEYRRIKARLAWVLRFIGNCRRNAADRDTGKLNVRELAQSEKRLLAYAQEESFDGIKDPRISSLNPYVDQGGLIRVKTLVSNRMDTFGFRHPVVLDPSHHLVSLYIRDQHQMLNHAGIQIVMNKLREKVWILSVRRAVRKVLSNCIVCRRYSSKRLEAAPACLPEERVRDAAAFEVCGVDYAGPLFLRDGRKAWICLFTCGVYRAVHLELVSSLSTNGFLEALRRMIARRGRPSVVFSDNGTNFTGTVNLLKEVNWKKVAEYSAVRGIEWRFNPPSAPWWGGFWERLVRSVKDLLRKILGKACLDYEELNTVLCDCEAVINSRPITYIAGDPSQLAPLTPAMFIQDVQQVGVPDLDSVQHTSLNKRQKYRLKLTSDLRKRFREEYLGQLSRKQSKIQLEHCIKRLDWPLAVVKEVIQGRDGHVRVLRLKTASGELVRPVQRVFPLELSCETESAGFSLEKLYGEKTLQRPDSTNVVEETSEDSPVEGAEAPGSPAVQVYSRRGRAIRKLSRMDL